MGINFKSQAFGGHFPELYRGECRMLPGGFKPANEIAIGAILRPGVPLFVNFDEMSAAVCKTALVVNGGSTTAPRVAKGHYFAVGDSVAVNEGTANATVKSIDTENADYDVITFDKEIAGIKADDVLIECESDLQSGKAAPKYVPNMIVGAEKEFKTTGINTIDAGYDAIVLIPSLANTPMLPEWLSGVCLKNNPNIIYIKQ